MSRLPLKIRVGIRDHWDDKDSGVRKSLDKLQNTLGLPVNTLIDFPLLWDELQKQYPPQDTFIQDILSLVQTWAGDLTSRLENDEYSAWTERFLEMIGRSLVVRVDALPVNTVKAMLSANFTADLDGLFTTDTDMKINDEIEWAEVGMPSRNRPPVESPARRLPVLSTLDRPEILFPAQLPYHLLVKSSHNSIIVQGSHQPSLELLHGYFQKHVRRGTDSQQTPLLAVKLRQSLFGYGPLKDSVELSPYDPRALMGDVNPLFILSFVESVLGYQLVPQSSDANQWYFKRDTPCG
ncbi:MAG: hypothetical protein Q9220_006710 [cf. Caloplaca sp. 1 TL-2023]